MAQKPSYRVVTLQQEPFVMYDKSTRLWSGFCIDLLEEFAKILNFTYVISESHDLKYGGLNSTTMEWNGMIRELIDGTMDMAIAPMWMTRIRETAIDFTEPYYERNGIRIVMKNVRKQVSFFRFLTILERDVWLSFLGVFLLTSILLYFLELFSPYSHRNSKEKDKNEIDGRFCHLKECFWFTLTSFTAAKGDEMPQNLSGKLCAVTWWLFSFIITAAYMANLGAYQTSLRMEGHVESLEDLRRQYKIEYSTVYNSPTYHYFNGMVQAEELLYQKWESMSLNDSMSSWDSLKLSVWDYPFDDTYTKMFLEMSSTGFPNTTEEAMARVRGKNQTQPFAFITEGVIVRYLVLTSCDLLSVGREIAKIPYAVAVQQGSPLRDKLNFAIRKLYAEKRMEQLMRKWWDENPARILCGYDPKLNDGIGMDYMAAVFSLILLGIAMSLLILCIQYWWYYYVPRAVFKNSKRVIAITNVMDG